MKWVPIWIAATIIALSSIADTVPPDGGNSYSIKLYGIAEEFEWREYLDGRELLSESGPIFGFGADMAFRLGGPFLIEGCGEFFLGEVDYDGYVLTNDSGAVPYHSDTQYLGVRLDLDLAYRLSVRDNNYLQPYSGLGLRAWERTLDTQFGDRYIGRYGYTEDWLATYAIVGLKAGVHFRNTSELYASCEARLPIENWLTVDLSNVNGPDDIELEPGKRTSYYAELGYNAHPISISVYYETLEFSQSPTDDSENYFQPESEAEMIGAKIGLIF